MQTQYDYTRERSTQILLPASFLNSIPRSEESCAMDKTITAPDLADNEEGKSENVPFISLEECMNFIDFKIERSTPQCVEGRFVVSEKSCQPFNVLHGGVSAMIAESLASAGAFLASGSKRVAGIELNINHLKAAPVGTEVFASAKPVHSGKRLHVWDVTLWKVSRSDDKVEVSTKIAVSRVTVMVVGQDKEASELNENENQKPLARL